MTGYRGPQDIPPELAEGLMQALNPILDIVATQPVDFIGAKWQKPASRKVEENRWILWRAVNIAREALLYSRHFSSPWPESPAEKRSYAESWGAIRPWQLTCGRPTKKGEPCKLKLSRGRAYCWIHSTQDENDELRIWQDAVHIPYPRVKSEMAQVANGMDVVAKAMAQMLKELS